VQKVASLLAQALSEDFTGLDPSHPLGGPDGGKDAVAGKADQHLLMAVYFPRGQQDFQTIKEKFLDDLTGVADNNADAMAFVTNQELTLGQRETLKTAAESVPVELYHLERLTAIMDTPAMHMDECVSCRRPLGAMLASDATGHANLHRPHPRPKHRSRLISSPSIPLSPYPRQGRPGPMSDQAVESRSDFWFRRNWIQARRSASAGP
jgi:hypothetical protein